ncbi:MAG: hypothetical protein KTR17_08005 [Cellvibrionaceae bacterium]|nr:hypothetical protein [Cellvibrionaceae bacterium]
MEASNLVFIVVAEVAALLTLLCLFLLFKNNALRKLVQRLKERIEQLLNDLRLARKQPASSVEPKMSYRQFLELQLEMTHAHHRSLRPEQDIVLDIDPGVPSSRRCAALRHAILSIEIEATAAKDENTPNWSQIDRKYEQLFNFQEEYAAQQPASSSAEVAEVERLTDELKAAKKRVDSLEKFRSLYLDLEARWQGCQNSAKNQYDELSGIIASIDNAEQSQSLRNALSDYHAIYAGASTLISEQVVSGRAGADIRSATDSLDEIRQLKVLASDQHRIISELQRQLVSSVSDAPDGAALEELTLQLDKQIRFVKEAETCIQLMENELNMAHEEIESLKLRQSAIPQLKSELKELRDSVENYETQIYTLRASNQRLNRDMKELKNQAPEPGSEPALESGPESGPESGESHKLKKKLLEMEAKYAALEEKFLDLKLGS